MIIAECGINWQGSMDLAKQLIGEAKRGGGDLAKFQLYETDAFPAYKNSKGKDYAINKRHELTFDQAKELFEYGKEIGMEVFFSLTDVERVKWCEEIGVKRYKIAYSQQHNEGLLDAIPKNKKVYVSKDKQELPFGGNRRYLYCKPLYPTQFDQLKFNEIKFGSRVYWQGFSDHTINLTAAKVAISRGAKVIEKHFCLTREGQPDNPGIAGSMTPSELRELRQFYDEAQQCL